MCWQKKLLFVGCEILLMKHYQELCFWFGGDLLFLQLYTGNCRFKKYYIYLLLGGGIGLPLFIGVSIISNFLSIRLRIFCTERSVTRLML